MAKRERDLVDMVLDDIDRTIDHLKLRRTGTAGERRKFFSARVDQLIVWRDELRRDCSRVFDLCERVKGACDEWRGL